MISFQDVTYSYQESGEPKSLDSIHLEVKDGECILLCGKSGCGKTTEPFPQKRTQNRRKKLNKMQR